MKAVSLLCALCLCVVSCSYDETLDLLNGNVQLVYPANSIEPYAGARVELRDSRSSIFVDSTDAAGRAHFVVPAGIYEASSSGQKRIVGEKYDTIYNYNGVRSLIVVSPDSSNQVRLDLKVSFRRVFK